jgi:DNA invertase Pin-like site-specific DNA recombinase
LQNQCRSGIHFNRVSLQDSCFVLIGYARVSAADQSLSLQADALTKAGCDRVFSDHSAEGRIARDGLSSALSHLRPGDELVVWKLDRLGRTARQLVGLIEELQSRQVGFRSLTDGIHTSSPVGRLFFHVMAALAEMERDLVRERTRAGLAAARARGREGGRRPKLSKRQVEHARSLLADPKTSVSEVASTLGVARSTLYRAIGRATATVPS